MDDSPLRLAVLISGGGTTLDNLRTRIDQGALAASVVSVIADRPCRGADNARAAGLPTEIILRRDFASTTEFSTAIFDRIRAAEADLVALGGFLARIEIPDDFVLRVMNIHPALIPSFCGKGMYGHHVHEAVLARGCQVSGCTVHFCDNEYDHGPIILQRCVDVAPGDTPDTLAARVFAEECRTYPEAIRLFAEGRLRVVERRVFVDGNNG